MDERSEEITLRLRPDLSSAKIPLSIEEKIDTMFGIVTLVACQSEFPEPEETAVQENHILLITVDTLRADRIGAYGDPLAQTPNMDSLASEGFCFEKHTV